MRNLPVCLTLLGLAACGKGDLSISATGRVVPGGLVELAVTTEAGASVTVDVGGTPDPSQPPVVADASGHATVRAKPTARADRSDLAQSFWVVARDGGREGKTRVELKIPQLSCRLLGDFQKLAVDCTGGKTCTGEIPYSLVATFSEIDRGATVELAGAKATASGPTLELSVDPRPLLATASVSTGASLALPLAITFADGARLDTTCTLDAPAIVHLLAPILGEVVHGPVTFGPSDTGASANRSLYMVSTHQLLGAAATVRDIDLVAIVDESQRKASCGTYGNEIGTLPIVHVLTDATATVYDRRTGKSRGTKRFPAVVLPCPERIEEGRVWSSHYDDAAVAAWTASLLAR